MAGSEDFRVFVGGLAWDSTDRDLGHAFRRFGKVLEAKVMLDRETGRPRGFGFVTFADEEGVERAITELHDRELDGRIVSVNKAHPKIGGGGYSGYTGGYSNGGRRGEYGGGRGFGREECFKCGQLGHWARECPSVGVGRDRYGAGRGDRYGGGPGYSNRRGDRDRYPRDRYGESDRYGDGNYKDGRSGGYPDRGARDRYDSGGPARYEGSYRERSGPYDRASGGRQTYDDRY